MKRRNLNIAIVILIVLSLTSCDEIPTLFKKTPSRQVNVHTIEVYNAVFENCKEYVGTLEESFSTELCFETTGRVEAVYVKDGQRVSKGQLIAQVDTSMARHAYDAAKATLDQALDGYSRAKKVYDKGSMPEVKWIEIQTQLQQAQSMEQIAKKRLDDCWLKAPVAGTISDRSVEVGSTVSPLLPVVKIVGMDGLYVKASVPEVDINKVKVGALAKVQIKAIGDSLYTGKVTERDVSADKLSRGYSVRIKLQGDSKDLFPGMVCKVMISSHQEDVGYDIPSRAVQLDNDGSRYVWVVVDGAAQRKYVKIDDLTATGVLVKEGLQDGDEIIVDGAHKVATGTKVVVVK